MHVKLSTSRKLSMALLALLAAARQTLQLYVDPRFTSVRYIHAQKLGQKMDRYGFRFHFYLNPGGLCLPSLLVIQSIRRVSRPGRLGKLEKTRLRVNSGPKKKLQSASLLTQIPSPLLYLCQMRLPPVTVQKLTHAICWPTWPRPTYTANYLLPPDSGRGTCWGMSRASSGCSSRCSRPGRGSTRAWEEALPRATSSGCLGSNIWKCEKWQKNGSVCGSRFDCLGAGNENLIWDESCDMSRQSWFRYLLRVKV